MLQHQLVLAEHYTFLPYSFCSSLLVDRCTFLHRSFCSWFFLVHRCTVLHYSLCKKMKYPTCPLDSPLEMGGSILLRVA